MTLCEMRDLLFKNVLRFFRSQWRRSEEKSSAQKIAKITKKKPPGAWSHPFRSVAAQVDRTAFKESDSL
jgi:hypothetical protein